jgi:urease gamma subunit
MMLTINEASKAQFAIKIAETRLAEAYKLAEEGKNDLSQKALNEYDDNLTLLSQYITNAKQKGEDVKNLMVKVQANIVKEQKVQQFVEDKLPKNSPEALNAVKSISAQSLQKVLELAAHANVSTPSYELQENVKNILQNTGIAESIRNNIERAWKDAFKDFETSPSAETTP